MNIDAPTPSELEATVLHLSQENTALAEALRLLYDHQNGCPLPKYEQRWNEAMEMARTLLAAHDARRGITADQDAQKCECGHRSDQHEWDCNSVFCYECDCGAFVAVSV